MKKTVAESKKLFKNKKRDHFKKFVNNINFSTNNAYVWNTCKILKNKWVKVKPSHTSENHQHEKLVNLAVEKISPPWAGSNPDWLPPCRQNHFLSAPFEFKEFNLALNSKKSSSSPGLDGLSYECIGLLPIKYKLLLLDIFNEMYTTNAYPANWKKSYIHFIKKLMVLMSDQSL